MFEKEDKTYDDLRDRSIEQWLKEISSHDDIAVRGGVKVTREYIEYLKKTIKELEKKSDLKDKYLKKLKLQSYQDPK